MTAASDGPMIAVLDYGIGNLRSAQKALEVVGADARLTADGNDIAAADGVILPGVGSFGACMNALRSSGLDHLVLDTVDREVPFLGICVGMQMLFEGSDEAPGVPGLGIFSGQVRWLPEGVKRPQMQWNRLSVMPDALLAPKPGRPEVAMTMALADGLHDQWMYFVHSLAAEATAETLCTVDYGGPVTAAVGRGRIFATQFHPEKSAQGGLALLGRFVDYCRAPVVV